jgi:hypothetical protein
MMAKVFVTLFTEVPPEKFPLLLHPEAVMVERASPGRAASPPVAPAL